MAKAAPLWCRRTDAGTGGTGFIRLIRLNGLAAVATATLLLCTSATAAPAGWYWWVSSRDADLRVCAQYMPAPHWLRAQGPFRNLHCTR